MLSWRIRAVGLLLLGPTVLAAQSAPERRVILVTFDGVRTEEFFGGLDSVILSADRRYSGVEDSARLRRDYGRDTPEARRHAVMPFFWDSLAPTGMVFGDTTRGSRVSITNPHGFSAPGYEEILTGHWQSDVTSNDRVRYTHRTVLEIVRERLRLRPQDVALFGSWENLREYGASRDGAVLINAGYDTLPTTLSTPTSRLLQRLQQRALAMWEGSRLDAFTGGMGLEYLRSRQPRLMYFSFDDTDDLAHNRRYDRVLDALHSLDDFLRELSHTVDSLPAYRGRTTIILTTDHGRGHTPADWSDHGADVEGSRKIWLGVFGPFTPRVGVVSGGSEIHQAQVSATILEALGLDPTLLGPEAEPPVPGAIAR